MADVLPLALTTAEWVEVASAGIPGVAAFAAVMTVRLNIRNERRRTQPIVIAHEESPRRFARDGEQAAWVVTAYLTSEGAGPAFNVRFGVELNGVRYPYRMTVNDPGSGNVQRVLKAGERRPPEGSAWPILIDSLSLWGRAADSKERGDLDERRVYWARYQNAYGETWETINPGNRSAPLVIRRVRRLKRVERREEREREKAGKRDIEWERKAREELLAGMSDTERTTAEEQS